MAATNPSLFTWQDVDILPDMYRLELVLQYLPDQPIVEALQQKRGRGRDDYPIAAMWNAVNCRDRVSTSLHRGAGTGTTA